MCIRGTFFLGFIFGSLSEHDYTHAFVAFSVLLDLWWLLVIVILVQCPGWTSSWIEVLSWLVLLLWARCQW